MTRRLHVPSLAQGIFWLSGFGIAGLAVELALTRHWKSWTQGIAWLALALLAWAWWRLRHELRSRGHASVARRRIAGVALLVAASSGLGIAMHILGNFEAGPLDAIHGKLWAATPLWRQWWLAISMRVGPAPSLAPGALALLAGMLWLLATTPSDAD